MTKLFTRIDTVFLKVKDFDAAIGWYTKRLGFTVRWRDNDGGYAALEIGETPLTLVRAAEGEEILLRDHAMFNFYTPNIQQAHQQLQDQGVFVEPVQDYGNVLSFDFKDPDGNRIGVCHFEE